MARERATGRLSRTISSTRRWRSVSSTPLGVDPLEQRGGLLGQRLAAPQGRRGRARPRPRRPATGRRGRRRRRPVGASRTSTSTSARRRAPSPRARLVEHALRRARSPRARSRPSTVSSSTSSTCPPSSCDLRPGLPHADRRGRRGRRRRPLGRGRRRAHACTRCGVRVPVRDRPCTPGRCRARGGAHGASRAAGAGVLDGGEVDDRGGAADHGPVDLGELLRERVRVVDRPGPLAAGEPVGLEPERVDAAGRRPRPGCGSGRAARRAGRSPARRPSRRPRPRRRRRRRARRTWPTARPGRDRAAPRRRRRGRRPRTASPRARAPPCSGSRAGGRRAARAAAP